MNYIIVFLVYHVARWWVVFQLADFLDQSAAGQSLERAMSTYTMCAVLHNLARILEAPLTYVQPVGLPPTEKIFWVDRRVPRLNVQVSKHDV